MLFTFYEIQSLNQSGFLNHQNLCGTDPPSEGVPFIRNFGKYETLPMLLYVEFNENY